MELSDEVYSKIAELSEKGDNYAEKEQFTSALKQYQEALAMLPEPKTDWEAATWLYVAIGDAWFNKQNLDDAMDAYQKALMSPDGTGNAYIWFCIGQVYFEQDNIPKAKLHFMSAYMLDGNEIFEEENPEYFALIKAEADKSPMGEDETKNEDDKPNGWLPPDWEKDK